jgi:uncharacterized protein YycO
MRKIIIVLGIISLTLFGGLFAREIFSESKPTLTIKSAEIKNRQQLYEIKEGDLIFQTSLSGQSKAIQLATKSKYSHCGLIFKDGNDFYVLEAFQPVKRTPLNEWIARGKEGKYVIKRLKYSEEIVTTAILNQMKTIGDDFLGKDYDLTFEWTDQKIYCSELIWKIYQRTTGIEIGKLEKLKDFDLTSPAVKQKMKERYGNQIPMEETVISPAAIFESELLLVVKEN